MSISGMTGFARAEGEHEGLRWIWELKSVNGRGLDVKLRTPAGFDALDPPARAAIAARFKRGSVQVNLMLARDPGRAQPVRVDVELVERLLAEGEPFIKAKRVKRPRWDGLLAVRGVVLAEDAVELSQADREALDAALLAGFDEALGQLAEARRAEGHTLAGVLRDGAERVAPIADETVRLVKERMGLYT